MGLRSLPPGAPEDPAEDAAQDLPADLAADGARGLLGHRFHHALATRRAPEDVAHLRAERGLVLRRSRLLPRGPILRGRGFPRRSRARARGRRIGRDAALAEDLVRRLAIHAGVVLTGDRALRADRRALVRRDRAHPAARRTNHRALHLPRHALALA